jgi:starch synthase
MGKKKNAKKILFVSGEAAPFITTGGLCEVVGALPKSLAAGAGAADVRVVLPLYEQIKAKFAGVLEFFGNIYVNLGWRRQYCGIFTAKVGGVMYSFLDNE